MKILITAAWELDYDDGPEEGYEGVTTPLDKANYDLNAVNKGFFRFAEMVESERLVYTYARKYEKRDHPDA